MESFLTRLPPEILDMIGEELDMPSICSLRLVSSRAKSIFTPAFRHHSRSRTVPFTLDSLNLHQELCAIPHLAYGVRMLRFRIPVISPFQGDKLFPKYEGLEKVDTSKFVQIIDPGDEGHHGHHFIESQIMESLMTLLLGFPKLDYVVLERKLPTFDSPTFRINNQLMTWAKGIVQRSIQCADIHHGHPRSDTSIDVELEALDPFAKELLGEPYVRIHVAWGVNMSNERDPRYQGSEIYDVRRGELDDALSSNPGIGAWFCQSIYKFWFSRPERPYDEF